MEHKCGNLPQCASRLQRAGQPQQLQRLSCCCLAVRIAADLAPTLFSVPTRSIWLLILHQSDRGRVVLPAELADQCFEIVGVLRFVRLHDEDEVRFKAGDRLKVSVVGDGNELVDVTDNGAARISRWSSGDSRYF